MWSNYFILKSITHCKSHLEFAYRKFHEKVKTTKGKDLEDIEILRKRFQQIFVLCFVR